MKKKDCLTIRNCSIINCLRSKELKGKECVNREKWKEQMPLIMAFMIPLVIALAVCIDHGVYPVDERSILQVDVYHQYCPFFAVLMV